MNEGQTGRRLGRAGELALSGAALAGAIALNYAAGRMADAAGVRAHTSPDLVLSLLPVLDLRAVFVWGFGAFLVFAVLVTAWRERRHAAYILWMYALLVAVRSFFIVLTPMKEPEGALSVQGDPLFDAVGRYLTFRHDLFFSAHTALPFLGFLLFRDRWVRAVFLALSILLAATVLFCRIHYSIDVAAAYFITYAVYRGEIRWFRAPYRAWRRRWVLP